MADNAEMAALPNGWPFPDLPANGTWQQTEYGVMHDRREQGHGIALAQVTTDIERALDAAQALDGKGHVRVRLVTYSPWSSPLYDDRAPVTSSASTPEEGSHG